MDTRFLDTLTVVVACGSIAGAARRQNLTPAAVAQRIHALEQEFGTKLLVRSGKTVKPTENGLAIAQEGLILLKHASSLRALANKDKLHGELRIGSISTALLGLLPDAVAEIARKYAGVSFYFVPGLSTELYRQVEEELVDVAIIVEPRFVLGKSLKWRTVREEPLVLIVHEELPEMDAHDILRSQRFIRYDRMQWGGRQVDNYLKEAGIRPEEWMEMDALDAIAALVSRGLGVALVPDWSPPWQAGLKIRKIPLPPNPFVRKIGIVWKSTSTRAELIRVFAEEVVKQSAASSAPS
ncbi:LysR family transcriptional regulator [Microvirga antarctica]|uniref:LysR family transcriptional regulator n=1 Tax=Microvirga antarctica TaxID=2819233 RepID=UPI001B313E17|nr:LysR family transcriptional regulator [Microvirga antarctica]